MIQKFRKTPNLYLLACYRKPKWKRCVVQSKGKGRIWHTLSVPPSLPLYAHSLTCKLSKSFHSTIFIGLYDQLLDLVFLNSYSEVLWGTTRVKLLLKKSDNSFMHRIWKGFKSSGIGTKDKTKYICYYTTILIITQKNLYTKTYTWMF